MPDYIAPKAKVGAGAPASIGSGVLVCWLWNTFMPEHQMPAEVGAIVGGLPAYFAGLITEIKR